MNDFYHNPPTSYSTSGTALSQRVSQVMKRVYFKMFIALIVSGLTAWYCASSPAVTALFRQSGWIMWVLVGVELILVFSISGYSQKMSTPTATLLFYLFAVVNGLTLYPIILVYTGVSIAKTFFITAGVFGAMSVYGFFTSRDLSRIGSILFMALIALIIAMVVNIFLHSSTMEWIVSIAGVLIFTGLTAWDTQQVKRMAMSMPSEMTGRLAVVGALTLYLDFVNLFLFLLNFLGNSRD